MVTTHYNTHFRKYLSTFLLLFAHYKDKIMFYTEVSALTLNVYDFTIDIYFCDIIDSDTFSIFSAIFLKVK